MIPYWSWTHQPIPVGPLELHLFGILVGMGVLFGAWQARKHAEERGLKPIVIADLAIFVVIIAFIMAHQVSLFAYFPERVFGTPCPDGLCPLDATCGPRGRCDDGDWLEVVRIWNGISSFGGFLGAAIALALFFRFERIVLIPKVLELTGGKGRPAMRYMDSLAFGFGLGWIFGRLGCFSAHDHVGKASESFLAVNFPDGWRSSVPAVSEFGAPGFTPRFDLGLLEVFWAVAIFALYWFYARKRQDLRPGWYCAVMCISYAPYRFFLDTLRATDIGGADTRYFQQLVEPGLTPGHVGAVIVLGIGLAFWFYGGKLARDPNYPKSDPVPAPEM